MHYQSCLTFPIGSAQTHSKHHYEGHIVVLRGLLKTYVHYCAVGITKKEERVRSNFALSQVPIVTFAPLKYVMVTGIRLNQSWP